MTRLRPVDRLPPAEYKADFRVIAAPPKTGAATSLAAQALFQQTLPANLLN
jgi:hypothetical protein